MEKPVIGQKLFSLNVGNAARHCEQKLTEVVVTKVGRKYFEVMIPGRAHSETQFHLDNWRQKTEYSVDQALYKNEQEWENEIDKSNICNEMWRVFEYGHNRKNVSLEDLKKISEIISKY